jgi:hypothetical protein
MLGYALLCLPLLTIRKFDPSVFVVAGDHYVTAEQTHPSLRVKTNSDGYDGQFYYRMTVRPFSTAAREDGIAFDHPSRRLSRMFFPLLAWAASLGRAAWAAWAMLGVNIAGLGAVAWCSRDLAQRFRLPNAATVAIVLWPGFVVSLLHDTTEIVAAALVLGSLCAWFSRRLLLYAALAGCAGLARETTLPVWAGLAAHSLIFGRNAKGTWPDWRLLVAAIIPFVPFFAFREYLSLALHEAPEASGLDQLGWPFQGGATMIWECLSGARRWASTPLKDALERAYVLLSALPLMAFYGFVAMRVWRTRRGEMAAIGCAWLGTAVLMSLPSARGPWIDPAGYLRAFTECYVVGCLVAGSTFVGWRELWVTAICGVQVALAWAFCMIQLR